MYLSIMQGIKYILLIAIFGLSTAIGVAISKIYENRKNYARKGILV